MNKNLLFLFLLLSTVLFFSCNKDNSPGENTDKNPSGVKSYTVDYSSPRGRSFFTYQLTYDNKDRITLITIAEDPNFKKIYEYPSGDRYTMKSYRNGITTIYEEYFLKNSRLDSLVSIVNTNDSTTAKFHYDARNLLIRQDMFEHRSGPQFLNTNLYSYDVEGNLLQYSNSFKDIYAFEYYPNLVNEGPIIEPLISTPIKKNLVKRMIRTTDGKVGNDVTTTYTFDDKNRIHTMTETSTSGNTSIYTYSYF